MLNCFDANNANPLAGEWKTASGVRAIIENWLPTRTGLVVGEINYAGVWYISFWRVLDATHVITPQLHDDHIIYGNINKANCPAFDLCERKREGHGL